MRYVAIFALLFSSVVNASETTDAIKAACGIEENKTHPVCVKRANRVQKARDTRERNNQRDLDAIISNHAPTH